MSDLVTFVRARLDEDEAVASGLVELYGHTADAGLYVYNDEIAISTARVLREVEAKRRIVDEYAEAVKHAVDPAAPEMTMWVGTALDFVVGLLAGVWSDHPDYDPAWRP